MSTNGRIEVARIPYPYLNRFGTEVIKTRIEYADGDKKFEWPTGTKAEDVLLWNADLLSARQLAEEPVYIVEGEKTANILVAAGLCAVSFAGGSSQKKFGAAILALKGRHIIIWPDSDKAGLDFACHLYTELRKVGVASIRVIEPIWGKEKGTDAADLLEGVDAIDARKLVSEWVQSTIDLRPPPKIAIHTAADLLTMTFPPVKQIVPGLFSASHYLLSGAPKSGKSFLAMTMATGLAAGGYCLGKISVDQRPVLYLSLEDGLRRTVERLATRLAESGAPPGLDFIFSVPDDDEQAIQDTMKSWLTENQDGVIFIDTGKRLRMGRQDDSGGSTYDSDYEFAAPITDLAHDFDTMVITVWHDRKLAADDFFDAVNASRGLTAAVDGVAQLTRQRGTATAKLIIGDRDNEERAFNLKWDEQLTGWLMVGSTDVADKVTADVLIRKWMLANNSELGVTPEQIAEGTGLNVGTVRNTLTRMKERFEVYNNKPTRPGKWFLVRDD